MKHCNFCGTNNPDTSKFCSNCGRNLEYRISNVTPKQDRKERGAHGTTSYDEKSMPTLLKVVITILLIGLLIVCIVFLFGDDGAAAKKYLAPIWFVVIYPILKKIWD